MSLPFSQGQKSEWALLRAHASGVSNLGAQICANKPWQAVKAVEAITTLIPSQSMKLIDLNCGCPIDLVYRSGGGSALLDQHGKLFKMLISMAYVSGETPITCKIRMDSALNVKRLLYKLWMFQQLHYMASSGIPVNQTGATLAKVDTSDLGEGPDAPISTSADRVDSSEKIGRSMHFIGNGDVNNVHHTAAPTLSSVMVARGALIKPWIFEETSANQHLDKSTTERPEHVKDFVRYRLETWGDEFGVGTTRRFLLEWLCFTCRYIPVGLLEYLPPKIHDWPPLWRGRNELDWIKIR